MRLAERRKDAAAAERAFQQIEAAWEIMCFGKDTSSAAYYEGALTRGQPHSQCAESPLSESHIQPVGFAAPCDP
jgi:hypothetical protein